MSALANIVVPDAAATPVNHTFAPQGRNGSVARWKEKLAALAVGWWDLAMNLREPINGNKQYRFTFDLGIPTTKTYTDTSGNSQTVVDYVTRYQLTAILPANGTLQSRKDARKIFVGIMNDAQVIDQVENLAQAF